jgi:hypothetical protein
MDGRKKKPTQSQSSDCAGKKETVPNGYFHAKRLAERFDLILFIPNRGLEGLCALWDIGNPNPVLVV